MKLKNLVFGSMILAAALVSCSNNDEPATSGEAEAYISIAAASSDIATKADANQIGKEAFVSRLTAFVYKGGSLYQFKDTASTSSHT